MYSFDKRLEIIMIDYYYTISYNLYFTHPHTNPLCIKKIEEHLDNLIRYKKLDWFNPSYSNLGIDVLSTLYFLHSTHWIESIWPQRSSLTLLSPKVYTPFLFPTKTFTYYTLLRLPENLNSYLRLLHHPPNTISIW